MDAADLFGGAPDRTDVIPSFGTVEEPPRSAASLFGGEIEGNPLPGSLQSKVVPIQDMPDDLFGDSGGDRGRGGGSVEVLASDFGAPPDTSRSSHLQGVPDGMFDEAGDTCNAKASFRFGAGSKPTYDGRNAHAAVFPRPVDSVSGRLSPPVHNNVFDQRQPSRGIEAVKTLVEGTWPRGAAAEFDAPPNDLFGAPPSKTATWWGADPPAGRIFSSAPSAERLLSFDETPTQNFVGAAPPRQGRTGTPLAGGSSGGIPSHATVSSGSPMNVSASVTAGYMFGVPPTVASVSPPPPDVFKSPWPSALPPKSEDPVRSEQSLARRSGSPLPPPHGQTLNASPRTELEGTAPTMPWSRDTNLSGSPPWSSQQHMFMQAKSPHAQDMHRGSDVRPRDFPHVVPSVKTPSLSPPAAAPSAAEPNKSATENFPGGPPPRGGAFVSSRDGVVSAGVGNDSSGEAFGPLSRETGNASVGDPFRGSPDVGVVAGASDIFGPSTNEDDIFGGGASGKTGSILASPPSSMPLPFEAPGAHARVAESSVETDVTATETEDRQPTRRAEPRETFGFGAPLEAPPQNMFGFGVVDDNEEESTPWWQVGMEGVESLPALSGNDAGGGLSDTATITGKIFDAQAETSTQNIPKASRASAATEESEGLGAPPAAMSWALAKEGAVSTEAKQLQGYNAPAAGSSQQTSNSQAMAPFASHASFRIGENVPTDVFEEDFHVDSGVSQGLVKGIESPGSGWEKKPLAPLNLGVYGAPPDEVFSRADDDPFGAPEDADEFAKQDEGGFEDWGMCPADPVAAAKPKMFGEAGDTGETAANSPPEMVVTDAPPRPNRKKPFEGKVDLSSLRVDRKERELGEKMFAVEEVVGWERKDQRDPITRAQVPIPLVGHRGTRPGLDTPSIRRAMGSSFRVSEASTASIFEIETMADFAAAEPSAPARLFGTRSGSWDEFEATLGSDNHFSEVFSNLGVTPGEPQQEELTVRHGEGQTYKDTPLSTSAISAPVPDSAARANPLRSGVSQATKASAAGVEPSFGTDLSQEETEHGGDVDPSKSIRELAYPEPQRAIRNSFQMGDSSAVVDFGIALPVGLDAVPSSPPRLFASRSGSWSELKTKPESNTELSSVFSNPDANPDEPPREILAGRRGLGQVVKGRDALLNPAIIVSAPDSAACSSPAGSAVDRTTMASAFDVQPSSRRRESREETEGMGSVGPLISLGRQAGAWGGRSKTPSIETEAFVPKEGNMLSRSPRPGEPPSAADNADTSTVGSDAEEDGADDAKIFRTEKADGKEDEQHHRWGRDSSSAAPYEIAASVGKKIDASAAVDADAGWAASDDDWGNSDGAETKNANERKGLEARKEDADDAEQGPRNQPEDDQGNEGGDPRERTGGQDREDRDRTEENAEEDEQRDEMEDGFEWSGRKEHENDASVTEKTAYDFFAPSASLTKSGPESPRPIPRSDSSPESFSSLSPLSENGSVSRRDREDSRRKVGKALGRTSTISSVLASSPRSSLADVPPMFPPMTSYRSQRAIAGDLLPPLPMYPFSASAVRPTRRSLSPFRIEYLLEDVKRWSASPRLKSGATGSAIGTRAYSYSPERAKRTGALPAVRATERDPTSLSLPPSRDRQRVFGQSVDLAEVERLGQAKTNLPSSVSFGRNRGTAADIHSASAAADLQNKMQRSSEIVGSDPAEDSDVIAGDILPSSVDPSESQSTSLGEVADGSTKVMSSSDQDASRNSEGDLGTILPSRETGATNDTACFEPLAREKALSVMPSSNNPHYSRVGEDTWQTTPPLLATNPVSSDENMEGLSKSDPSAVEVERSPSRNAPEPRSIKERGEYVTGLDQGIAIGGARTETIALERKNWTRAAPSTSFSPDLLGQAIGDIGTAFPSSPIINTYSPLTQTRNEQSLYGVGKVAPVDDEAGGAGNNNASTAANLFAAEAPASSAGDLFAAQRAGTPKVVSVREGQLLKGNTEEGSNRDHELFSCDPPPEAAATPPLQSLPNTWGLPPLKQPLPEPKRWPMREETGLDRRPAPMTSSTENIAGRVAVPAFGNAEVAVPAGFAGSGSQVSDGGKKSSGRSFSTGVIKNVEAGRKAFRSAPASFMPPFGRGSSAAPGAVANPWGKNREGPFSSVGGTGKSISLRPSDPFQSASRTTAAFAAAPAVAKSSLPRFGMNFGDRSSGSGNWGSAATAALGSNKAPRDPSVRPPGVLAMFGFGGKLVCIHTRPKIRLAPAPGVVPPPDDGSGLRSGPIILWSLKDLAEPGKILQDHEAFPGPASSAPLDKLKKYVEGRANGASPEGERLLWSVTGLALQFKGRLASNVGGGGGVTDISSPEAALVKIFKAAQARQKNLTPTLSPLPASMSPATRGHSPWLSVPRPGASAPGGTRDAQLAFHRAGAGTPQGPLMRPDGAGHRTVGSGGGGGAGVFPGSTLPGVAPVGVGPFGSVPGRSGGIHGIGGAAPIESGSMSRGEGIETGSRDEVEALLVDGKKEEAVDASIRAGLWGLALLIAAQCSTTASAEGEDGGAPPHPTYQRVARLYANAFLQSGTSLHTMALVFSGQAGAAIKHGGKSLGGPMGISGDGSLGQGGFKESWMATAAAIVSNKLPGWSEQLMGLGDRLVESDEVPAAHALFLMAGMQVELPTIKGARLVLPGVDHRKPAHRALRTIEAIDAVHLLEVLDVTMKDIRGRSNGVVQAHKLRLAMRLADVGFLDKACEYARSTQAEVAAMVSRCEGVTEQRSPYSPQFISALREFEDRVRAALGTDTATNTEQSGSSRKERPAESAVAGAGGWLLKRVTNLVKTSATPGALPPGPRASSPGTQSNASGGDSPRQTLLPLPHTNALQQQQESHKKQTLLQEVAVRGKAGSSHLSGAGLAPATGLPTIPQGQQPLGQSDGPRPPGVKARPPQASAPTKNQSQGRPQPGTPAPHNALGQGVYEGFRGGGDETRAAIISPPDSFAGDTPTPLGPGVEEVAERPLDGRKVSGGVAAKRMPHVHSMPVLSVVGQGANQASPGVRHDQASPIGGRETGRDPNKNGAMVEVTSKAVVGEVEQPPKSEPRKGNKRHVSRRTSIASVVGTKPGLFAKMITKFLHPEAKHADVGNEMKAYFDKNYDRWVFPGENPAEAAAPAPSAPPTTAHLSTPTASTPQAIPGPDANDPLAALMAPPPASFGGQSNPAMTGVALGGGPPKMGGDLRSGEGSTTSGLSWASTKAPPVSAWGATGGAVKSPFGKLVVATPKAPASVVSTVDRGGSGSEGEGSGDDLGARG